MLRELVEVAERFSSEGVLAPINTKLKRLDWVIEISESGQARLKGYDREGQRQVFAPDRQRSGQISPTNLKPYLLVDNARYALGIAKRGNERADALAHQSFVDLLREAQAHTGEQQILRVLDFLSRPLPGDIREGVQPEDLVTFQCHPTDLLCEYESLRRFWSERLAEELLAPGCHLCCLRSVWSSLASSAE
jgi:CRISPR-associated protein Csd1